MDRETMALLGVTLADGRHAFDLLARRAGVGGNRGGSEDLEDHDCAVGTKPS